MGTQIVIDLYQRIQRCFPSFSNTEQNEYLEPWNWYINDETFQKQRYNNSELKRKKTKTYI